MYIRELNTEEIATVTLNYDELRCLNNSLYQLSKCVEIEKDSNFNSVYAQIIEVFALVKHGKIPHFELDHIHKLLNAEGEFVSKCQMNESTQQET